jgi:hypothetical protein
MSPRDHNKTLAILHSAIGAFYTLGLVASPWIIAQNFRRQEQIPTAVLIFGVVFLLALLFWSTAIAIRQRKPWGRRLALISVFATLPIFGLVGIYTWWFMHSAGAKQMYGVERD